MNQILDYNPDNKGGKKSSGSDNIVRVFAIIIIIFALALAGTGAYNLINKNKSNNSTTATAEKAKIEVEQQESQAVIKVTHTKAIEKIIFSWNNGKETTIKTTGETSAEQVIALPAGENTLHVKVTDVDGGESTYEGQFTSENGEDIINPVITLKVDEVTKKLVITATDETSLDFITYRWNSDEETKIEASEDDPTKIETQIDILKGVNDITVVAVDSNNNTTTETKSYTGVTKPEITITVSADKKSADIYVKHENGLQEVKLNLNGQNYDIDIGDKPTEVQFNVGLPDGENTLTVTAKSVEGTQTEAVEDVSSTTTIDPTETPSTEETTNSSEPTVTIEKSEDGQNAVVKINCESGIKEIKLNVNDVDYNIGGVEENQNYAEFSFALVDGNNKITVKATSTGGNTKEEVKEISK